jgi:hypothetical protein
LLRDGDGGIRQCRAADLVQVEPDDLVIGHTGGLRDTHRGGQLGIVPLAVIQAECIAREALLHGEGQGGGRVESTG